MDCGSESVVMRVPYDLAAEMIANCPASGDLQELQSWIVRAAARSQKLREVLKNHDLEVDGRTFRRSSRGN